MNITDCIPKDKYDIEAIELASQVGFPALEPALSGLLEWIKDANWPVAARTAALLSSAGPEIAPYIKAILESDDEVWKYWTIELVVRNLKPNVLLELHSELLRLAKSLSQDEQVMDLAATARSVLCTEKS